jgi:hypothetical protein
MKCQCENIHTHRATYSRWLQWRGEQTAEVRRRLLDSRIELVGVIKACENGNAWKNPDRTLLKPGRCVHMNAQDSREANSAECEQVGAIGSRREIDKRKNMSETCGFWNLEGLVASDCDSICAWLRGGVRSLWQRVPHYPHFVISEHHWYSKPSTRPLHDGKVIAPSLTEGR